MIAFDFYNLFFFQFPLFFIFIFILFILIFDFYYNKFFFSDQYIKYYSNNIFSVIFLSNISILLLLIAEFYKVCYFNFRWSDLYFVSIFNFSTTTNLFLNFVLIFSYIVFYALLLFYKSFSYKIKTVSHIFLLWCFFFSGVLLVFSDNFLSLYIALELSAICLYILAASQNTSALSIEAGIKYLILAALSSGLFLLGVAFLYFLTGSFSFSVIHFLSFSGFLDNKLFVIAFFFICSGILFKLGVAPFHNWVPDLYEGASILYVSTFAVLPKIFYLLAVYKIFFLFDINFVSSNVINYLDYIFLLISCFSILIGTLGALNQFKIKRFLAYGSISHMGYVLLFIFSCGVDFSITSFIGACFYLFNYALLSLTSFAILLIFFPIKKIVYNDFFSFEFSYFNRSLKFFVIIWICVFLSMAGIPPLLGFFSKSLLMFNLISVNKLFLAFFVILFSVVSVYYYIRFIIYSCFFPTMLSQVSLQVWSYNLKYYNVTVLISYLTILNFFSFLDISSFYYILYSLGIFPIDSFYIT